MKNEPIFCVLVQAIRQVLRGDVYLSPGIASAVMAAYRSKSDLRTA